MGLVLFFYNHPKCKKAEPLRIAGIAGVACYGPWMTNDFHPECQFWLIGRNCSSPAEGLGWMLVVMGGEWRASMQGRSGEPWGAG